MFPFIFGFQWQLFTAHFLCSTFSTEADVNLYFHVELPGRQLPQHCSFPGGSDRLKESFICLYSLCIWKVCFADTGPGNFFFSFNENINPADAKQWDPEFGKGFPLTVCIWAAGCVQTMGASGVPANRKGLSFRTGDKNLYFFFLFNSTFDKLSNKVLFCHLRNFQACLFVKTFSAFLYFALKHELSECIS